MEIPSRPLLVKAAREAEWALRTRRADSQRSAYAADDPLPSAPRCQRTSHPAVRTVPAGFSGHQPHLERGREQGAGTVEQGEDAGDVGDRLRITGHAVAG